MKKLFFLIFVILVIACKEENTPEDPINDQFDTENAKLVREGAWMGAGRYEVTGSAQIWEEEGKLTLLLNNFSADNGPDLKIYLSTDEQASSFLSLGALKSTNGKQSYEIPSGTDVSQYEFVLVWCQQFSVLFGAAALE